MIAYPVSRAELEARIAAHDASWLNDASQRTLGFIEKGRYDEKSSIWGRVKVVYLRLQSEKCAYCERKLESETLGKTEWDVEHYRPKSRIRAWKKPKGMPPLEHALAPVPNQGGYLALAYDPANYAVACKTCNSAIKSDYFPVFGTYVTAGARTEELMEPEVPALLLPVGPAAEDVERFVAFDGVIPVVTPELPARQRDRAIVTIWFFALHDVTRRKNLALERARCIVGVHPFLLALSDPARAADHAIARQVVETWCAPSAPHASCARSWCRLFERDRMAAHERYVALVEWLYSTGRIPTS